MKYKQTNKDNNKQSSYTKNIAARSLKWVRYKSIKYRKICYTIEKKSVYQRNLCPCVPRECEQMNLPRHLYFLFNAMDDIWANFESAKGECTKSAPFSPDQWCVQVHICENEIREISTYLTYIENVSKRLALGAHVP